MAEDICVHNPFPGLKGAFVIYSSSEGSGCADGHSAGSVLHGEALSTCVSPVSGRKRNSSSRQGFTRG